MSSSASGPELYTLLAACCERMVRNVLGKLDHAGYGHLTPSQAITVILVGSGIDTVTQIADRLDMTPQAVSKICGVLQAEGLLDREPHEDDARSRRLALTADGRRVEALLHTGTAESERAWKDLVGADAMAVLRDALTAYAFVDEPTSSTTPVRIRFS